MAIPLSDFQYIPNFVSEINAGFQKNDLTSYSDYRNRRPKGAGVRTNGNETSGTGSLAARALRGAEGIRHKGHVLCGSR
jgi:hypothetical protein